MRVEDEVKAWLDAKTRVLALYPELTDDEETLFDTVDGETSFDDFVARQLRRRREALAWSDVLKAQIDDMASRRKRFDSRADAIKELVRSAMEATGRTRTLALPEFTVTPGHTKGGVVIVDETQLPDRFVKNVKIPDKQAIKDAIDAGETVPGAAKGNGAPTLTVRQK